MKWKKQDKIWEQRHKKKFQKNYINNFYVAETQFAGPNEFLINKDDILSSVWYISSGSLEVLDKGMVVAILGKNNSISKHVFLVTYEFWLLLTN